MFTVLFLLDILFILKYNIMAYRKIVGDRSGQLLGDNFLNDTSSSYKSLSTFKIDTNFTGKLTRNYENVLTSFSKPINLDDLSLTIEDSKLVERNKDVVLNIDNSDLKSYIRYGNTLELIKATLNNIILNYPASLFVDSKDYTLNPINTIFDHTYNIYSNKTKLKITSENIVNNYGLIYDYNNLNIPDNNEIRNLNISYSKYCLLYEGETYNIINFTGNTTNGNYVTLEIEGIPFMDEIDTVLSKTFHIKPQPIIFNKFKKKLTQLEKYFLSKRLNDDSGFEFILKNPSINDNGTISYTNKKLVWPTSDGYNIDYEGGNYNRFIEVLRNISHNYDQTKTDIINRYLKPPSLEIYDNTQNKKIEKLMRVWGRNLDEIRKYIDALSRINKLSYDKKNNVPDVLVKNLARSFGWNDFTLLNNEEIINNFFSTDYEENKNDLLPYEIDIELWRRILINTNYFWKTKGTRNSIISMFKLIGIPEPFIKLTEYIYTVDDIIDVNQVDLTLGDLPSASLPYNDKGYPIAPVENNNFFFQISGNTDNGQYYINNFRNVGFQLNRTVDNKKSWVYSGATEREGDNTIRYYQESSDLIINTKEVDLSLDPSQAIEYDVFDYIKNKDYPNNSSTYAKPYTFININAEYEDGDTSFELPDTPVGNVQVNLNGITLTNEYSGGTSYDYYVDTNNEKLIHLNDTLINNGVNEDILVVTYLTNTNGEINENKISYIITKVESNIDGTKVLLPDTPNGDVQLTMNGITLSKSTDGFVGDYVINPINSQELLIINNDLSNYLQNTQLLQVSYLKTNTDFGLNQKIVFHKINSFSNNKFYYDTSINKYIYKLPHRINNVENLKVILNGITLSPNKDYSVNSINKYEIILPVDLRLGDVLGFYYVISDSSNESAVSDEFGVGDITELSFLEFIDLLKTKLINVRNRKTITDNNGGFYPTLLKVYIEYLRRGQLEDDNILKSNAYTHEDLFSFLNKYNSFFSSFVEKLIPATTIFTGNSSNIGGGFEVRNTVFNRQKFTYKRGVNINPVLEWTGEDGSTFKTLQ